MSKVTFMQQIQEISINYTNNHSGVMQQNIEMNLPQELFLRILCLENKLEKRYTIQHIDNLIVLYSQLVEHYNMKQDPIYIYFLEKIKNYLSKTNSLKLYFKGAEKEIDEKNNTWLEETDDSILISDEEKSPNKVLRDTSSQNFQLTQQASNMMRRDSFDNLIEQKRQQLRKSISFINYQQAKKTLLQEEIYDLERKRNERNLKLNVFKEVFLNQDNKNNEVKEIIKNYEELSKEKDNIVKSDIDQQMNTIQERIKIKRNNQFKKSLTIELNTPRSNRDHKDESNPKLSYAPPSSSKNEQKSELNHIYPSPSSKSENKISINQLSPHSQEDYINVFNSSLTNGQADNTPNKKAKLNIKNFHQKLGIQKTDPQQYEQKYCDQNSNSPDGLQNNAYQSSDEDVDLQSSNAQNKNKTHQDEYHQPSIIKEAFSQEQSFHRESVSPSKYMKDFGYDNE
ncbi:hypothetical protein TTHERM_00266629 (macronuclear) [Tetrahymena thermophila SB210]|uniref:Uncharacterized protein n=1 Tax=Tetrahymena thermophila (strain SB210) TaxID=312017 RepID=A4VDW9_TETTS|nr:hypothetical protein TTHERM_00266629 [Tetrahymena thermophila SB210]EDK31722.2 hypothetical protein TTHERM_00266629 [Tetrahymena thermophila SB210]|eukprot:XP_001470786.2 hypothetical protein TTHERM_00266629 [Tetrahymena thermophila SB210]